MELAERTGLSNQSISMIELGKRGAKNPPLSTIQILARAFGITVDELVAEPEPQEVA
jgi:transcriptional regulator with XRE-family HTH domain